MTSVKGTTEASETGPNTIVGRVRRSLTQAYSVPGVRGRRPLLAAAIVDALGSGLFLPISLLYLNVVGDQSITAAGEILSIAAFASIPVGLLGGAIVDRVGPRRVTVGAQVLQAVGFAGYLIFHQFALLAFCAFLAACGVALFWAANTTLVAVVVPEEAVGRWYGLEAALRNVGYAAGAAAAAAAIAARGPGPFRLIVMVDVASFVVAAGLLAWQKVPPRHREPDHSAEADTPQATYWTVLRDKQFMALMAMNVGLVFAGAALPTILTVFLVKAAHYPASLAAAMFVLNTVVISLVQGPVASWVDRHSRRSALAIAAGLYCLGSLGFAAVFVPRAAFVVLIIVSVVLYSAAEAFFSPAMSGAVVTGRPEQALGRYSGAYQFTYSVAFAAAPFALTALLTVNRSVVWLAVCAVSITAAGGALSIRQRAPGESGN